MCSRIAYIFDNVQPASPLKQVGVRGPHKGPDCKIARLTLGFNPVTFGLLTQLPNPLSHNSRTRPLLPFSSFCFFVHSWAQGQGCPKGLQSALLVIDISFHQRRARDAIKWPFVPSPEHGWRRQTGRGKDVLWGVTELCCPSGLVCRRGPQSASRARLLSHTNRRPTQPAAIQCVVV